MKTLEWEWDDQADEVTLAEARWAVKELRADGITCPCCGQFAKEYPRKVNSSMARDLICLYRVAGLEFAYLPSVRRKTGSRDNREESKLRYWSLAEELRDVKRPDGGRAGFWRVTEHGEAWILGLATITKYAIVYDNECLGFEGDQVTIRDSLADRFDYDELMRWQP